MNYNVIGLMSGSSLDGLDIVFASILESSGKWSYSIECAACLEYSEEWNKKLRSATTLSAREYQLLHTAYGKYTGEKVNEFIEMNALQHRVNLIGSHGHTTFHEPEQGMTHQLGEGATISATTKLPVVSDLRNLDVAFGGQGAPIVPMGEKLLFPDYQFFLNIGGIANISAMQDDKFIAYDVCAANRVLNMLAAIHYKTFDEGGKMAASGEIHQGLLKELNDLEYYNQPYPKSLANHFGTDVVFPLIQTFLLSAEDALSTYSEHIAIQIKNALSPFRKEEGGKLMITGGGAFNTYLIERISAHLKSLQMKVYIPEDETVAYKEALIMGLLGILRWREQNTVLASVTGATRNSVGGALWLGTEG